MLFNVYIIVFVSSENASFVALQTVAVIYSPEVIVSDAELGITLTCQVFVTPGLYETVQHVVFSSCQSVALYCVEYVLKTP